MLLLQFVVKHGLFLDSSLVLCYNPHGIHPHNDPQVMKMVKGFESMLAGSLDLEEPWYITGAEFNPVKNVIDVYVGIREDAVIACPHCGVQQVTAPFERQNSPPCYSKDMP